MPFADAAPRRALRHDSLQAMRVRSCAINWRSSPDTPLKISRTRIELAVAFNQMGNSSSRKGMNSSWRRAIGTAHRIKEAGARLRGTGGQRFQHGRCVIQARENGHGVYTHAHPSLRELPHSLQAMGGGGALGSSSLASRSSSVVTVMCTLNRCRAASACSRSKSRRIRTDLVVMEGQARGNPQRLPACGG